MCVWRRWMLLDQFVGANEERLRHVEAECLGGLQIDGKLKCHRLLNRKVPRCGPFQNLVNIARRASKEGQDGVAIRNQPTIMYKVAALIHSRNTAFRRGSNYVMAMRVRKGVSDHDRGVIAFSRHCRKGGGELFW